MKVIATTRTTQGTGASRRLRRADKLPGIIYGGKNPATPIELEHNPIFFALRKEKFHASILTMELDGKEELVVLRDFRCTRISSRSCTSTSSALRRMKS